MMIFTEQTTRNALVLDTFQALTEKSISSSLAVYRGRKLVIISESEKGMISRIQGVCKKIFNNFLFRIGLLSFDQTLVEKLKAEVVDYSYKRVDGVLQGKLKNLSETISGREAYYVSLQGALSQLQADVAGRTESKNQLDREMQTLSELLATGRREIAQHTCHLEQCRQAEGLISALEQQKASLQTQVNEIVKLYESVEPKRQEVSFLTGQISALSSRIEDLKASVVQHDFRVRYENEMETSAELRKGLSQQRGQVDRMKKELSQVEERGRDRERSLNSEIESLKRAAYQFDHQIRQAERLSRGREENLGSQVSRMAAQAHADQCEIERLRAALAAKPAFPSGTRIPVGEETTARVPSGRERIPISRK